MRILIKMKLIKLIFPFLIILAVGAFFRFYSLNWDANFHLHPDERFLTMVGNGMKLPESIIEYLDPQVSTFNPKNIGFDFFVYGLFPVSLNKIVALLLGNDNYNAFTIQGRFLSGIADTIIILLIFGSVKLLEERYKLNPKIKYFSSFLYAILVLPIQLSHFFAVDTFLNLFTFASFYFALRFWINKNTYNIFLSAIFFGLALSSKISAVFILPLIVFLIIHKDVTKQKLVSLLWFFLATFLTTKIADPYLFNSSNILDPRPNPNFLENLRTLDTFTSRESLFPPTIQWLNKLPIIFPLKSLALFGIGIPIFIVFLLGIFRVLKEKIFILRIIVVWFIAFFIYQGAQTAMTMRYFLILYPFVAILGALGIESLGENINKKFLLLIFLIISLPSIMFLSIYTKPHTRITATGWINSNIVDGSTILTEHWDDSLPLEGFTKYKVIQLPAFDPDTDDKWIKINDLLEQGDYIILSSNRGWGSITTVPEKYPRMAKFYKDLFEGKLEYKKVKEFTSYPSLSYIGLPITIPDDFAEENFTVFDHPKVLIFKK